MTSNFARSPHKEDVDFENIPDVKEMLKKHGINPAEAEADGEGIVWALIKQREIVLPEPVAPMPLVTPVASNNSKDVSIKQASAVPAKILQLFNRLSKSFTSIRRNFGLASADFCPLMKTGTSITKIQSENEEQKIREIELQEKNEKLQKIAQYCKDGESDTAFIKAFKYGFPEFAERIFYASEKKNNFIFVVIADACYGTEPYIVKAAQFLIDKNIDIEARNSEGLTPLMYLVSYFAKNVSLIKLLLDAGASIHAKNNQSLLSIASKFDNPQCLKILLDAGLSVDEKNTDEFGYTPLLTAVLKKEPRMVKILLDHGANLNIQIHDHWSPLMLLAACDDFMYHREENMQILKLLISNGANIFLKNKYGYTAEEIAYKNGNNTIGNFLSEHIRNLSPESTEERLCKELNL